MAITDLEIGAYRLMAETGLSAREISELDMQEYSRLTGRQSPTEAALQALGYTDEPPARDTVPAPEGVRANADAPQGISVQDMSMGEYAAFRHQLGLDKAGHDQGIFGAPGRQAQIDATRAQAGRTAMSQETHHPGFSRVFVNENAQPVQNRTGYYSGA
jgi:hypothetical protein